MVCTSTAHLALYHFQACPFCILTRNVINQLGLEIELRDTRKKPEHYQALLSGGGKSQVPCLRIETESGDITWLYESRAIIDYLNRFSEQCSHD